MEKKQIKRILMIFLVSILLAASIGCSSTEVIDSNNTSTSEKSASEADETTSASKNAPEKPGGSKPMIDPTEFPSTDEVSVITVGGHEFKVNYSIFEDFDSLPDDITVERLPIESFTRPEGDTHYYEVVYVPTENISWVQAAVLAESEGGYLVSLTSEEENSFVFNLINDEKYFWEFPDDYTPDSHYNIKIGPFIGGTKTGDSHDSKDGWVWLSGEEWSYTNWAQDLGDGVIDKDPRNNTQPNGRGSQVVMGFGELNQPVSTWGDYFQGVAQYENMYRPFGYNYGFIIEYDRNPAQ